MLQSAAIGLLVLALGASLGSFANVLVVRLKSGKGIGGRSHCLSCKKTLKARHLVPVASWFLLGGRCGMCRKPIHWQYPAVESAMAALTLVAGLRQLYALEQAAWISFAFEVTLSFCLLVIAAFDLRWQLVPIEFSVCSAILAGAFQVVLGADAWQPILGAAVTGSILGVMVLASRGKLMGEGDPVVGMLTGAALGFPLALAGLVISFIIGGCVALALLLQGLVTRKTPVPFAPFLAAGTLIAVWYAGPIGEYLKYVFA